ncbi:IclR family transcriptional regulator [Sphingobium sp. Sx8-8]|uniref:IclR family transcriptional regulator n=1 Tax=Sphingobium sp. Sx8-8 TaxID=2933617 RepID=UPI001F59800F|nr:IclR family transcriptional regulator [Sphingobium sp. Sx8-8]
MISANPDRRPRPPVNSVVQAISILRHLGTLPEGAGVNAIARAVGIGPSSCFNVLRTLVGEDLAIFDPATKRYTLGLGAVDLARRALGGDAMVRAARAPMDALAEEHDAAVGLWRYTGSRLVLVALAESASATRIHLVVGQRQPGSAGATGRAMLAAHGLSDAEIVEAYEGVRWHSAPGASTFLAQVRRAAELGWALDLGNANHGIASVASAIADRGASPRFVLSASIFDGREDAAGMARIGQALRAAALGLGKFAHGRMPDVAPGGE